MKSFLYFMLVLSPVLSAYLYGPVAGLSQNGTILIGILLPAIFLWSTEVTNSAITAGILTITLMVMTGITLMEDSWGKMVIQL